MPNHVRNIIRFDAGPEQIKKILEAIQDDESGLGSIDFNKLDPMPESLMIEKSSSTDHCVELYLTSINPRIPYFGEHKVSQSEYDRTERLFNLGQTFGSYSGKMPKAEIDKRLLSMLQWPEFHTLEDMFAVAKKALSNVEQYGHMDWYDWSVEHWGSKWNAYDCSYDGRGELSFNTAWSAVSPILVRLSQKFPEVGMTHRWADEDIGANVGEADYLGGKMIESHIPANCSVEAYEMAAEIRCEDLEEDCHLRLSPDGSSYEYREPEDDEGLEV